MNISQAIALRGAARAIIEACDSSPCGAPGGVMYAALMAQGCSLHQFEQMMSGLLGAGMVTKSGDCYSATAKGRKFIAMEPA